MQANPNRDARRTPALPKDSGAPALLEFDKLRKKKPLAQELVQNGLKTRPMAMHAPIHSAVVEDTQKDIGGDTRLWMVQAAKKSLDVV
jgi:hypothetical protein